MGKRLIHQRRGSANTPYISPSFKHKGPVAYPLIDEGEGVIVDLIHNPGTSSPVSVVEVNGKKVKMLAPEGAIVGDKIRFTKEPLIKPGNVLPLGSIPEGTRAIPETAENLHVQAEITVQLYRMATK